MKHNSIRSAMFGVLLPLASSVAVAGDHFQGGIIFDHTSTPTGLLIRFDPAVTPMPTNCAGASSNWMFIPQTSKIIVAVTLMALASGNRWMTVYTSGVGASGYCEINQVDPAS